MKILGENTGEIRRVDFKGGGQIVKTNFLVMLFNLPDGIGAQGRIFPAIQGFMVDSIIWQVS